MLFQTALLCLLATSWALPGGNEATSWALPDNKGYTLLGDAGVLTNDAKATDSTSLEKAPKVKKVMSKEERDKARKDLEEKLSALREDEEETVKDAPPKEEAIKDAPPKAWKDMTPAQQAQQQAQQLTAAWKEGEQEKSPFIWDPNVLSIVPRVAKYEYDCVGGEFFDNGQCKLCPQGTYSHPLRKGAPGECHPCGSNTIEFKDSDTLTYSPGSYSCRCDKYREFFDIQTGDCVDATKQARPTCPPGQEITKKFQKFANDPFCVPCQDGYYSHPDRLDDGGLPRCFKCGHTTLFKDILRAKRTGDRHETFRAVGIKDQH